MRAGGGRLIFILAKKWGCLSCRLAQMWSERGRGSKGLESY